MEKGFAPQSVLQRRASLHEWQISTIMEKFPEAALMTDTVGHHFTRVTMPRLLREIAKRRSVTLPPDAVIRGDISVAKKRNIP